MKPSKLLISILLVFLCFTTTFAQDTHLPRLETIWEYTERLQPLMRFGQGWASKIVWSPDGKTVVIGGSIGLWLYQADNLDSPPILLATRQLVSDIAYSPDGGLLAAGSDQIYLWDTATNSIARMINTDGAIVSLAFSPNGKQLVSSNNFGSASNAVWIWEVETGKEIMQLATESVISDLAYSPDGSFITGTWMADDCCTPMVWDAASGEFLSMEDISVPSDEELRALELVSEYDPEWEAWDTQLNLEETRVAAVNRGGDIRIWDIVTGQLIAERQGAAIRSVIDLSRDSKVLASAAWNHEIWLWEVATGQRISVLSGHTDRIYDVVFNSDGTLLASASEDGTARVWEVASGETLNIIAAHKAPVRAVSFTPDGKLYTAGEDNTIRLWDAFSGKPVTFVDNPETDSSDSILKFDLELPFWTIAFGEGSISVGYFDDVYLWQAENASTWDKIASNFFDHHVNTLAFYEDWLVYGGNDSATQIWDIRTHEHLGVVTTHNSWIYSIAIASPELIASAGCAETRKSVWDGSPYCARADLRIWNSYRYVQYIVPQGHTDIIRDLAFNPQATLLATASDDGTVLLWGVPVENP